MRHATHSAFNTLSPHSHRSLRKMAKDASSWTSWHRWKIALWRLELRCNQFFESRNITPWDIWKATAATIVCMLIGFALLYGYQEWKFRRDMNNYTPPMVSTTADDEESKPVSKKTRKRRKRIAEKEKASTEEEEVNVVQEGNAEGMQRKEGGAIAAPAGCPFRMLFGDMFKHDDDAEPNDEDDRDEDRDTLRAIRRKVHEGLAQKREELLEDLDERLEDEKPDGITLFNDDPVESPDPFDLAMHLPSHVKKLRNKIHKTELEKELTQKQMEEERVARRQQLEAIFKLMENEESKFGGQSVDDLQQQMRLYAI